MLNKTNLPLIEQRLHELLTHPQASDFRLSQAACYATFAHGKRFRPLLALAATQALQGDINLALTPACVLEIIHTYSMIHDDLPCMDDDDYRRGQLTVHKKFDEATAVLTGDYLLTYAFQLLAEAPLLSLTQKLQLITSLAKRAGGVGMIGGQISDIAAENTSITLEQLQEIHRKKTGQLLIAALEFGGIIAHASVSQMQQLEALGEEIGLAFQIIDDIIDVTNPEAKHGKTTSSDAINGKTTYVSLCGIEHAQLSAQKLLKQASARITAFSTPEPLASIVHTLAERIR